MLDRDRPRRRPRLVCVLAPKGRDRKCKCASISKRVSLDSSDLEGGAEGDRTPDLCIANAALSQLSYRPNRDAESSFCAGSVNQKTAHAPGSLGSVPGSWAPAC